MATHVKRIKLIRVPTLRYERIRKITITSAKISPRRVCPNANESVKKDVRKVVIRKRGITKGLSGST